MSDEHERQPIFLVNLKNKGWTFVRLECFQFIGWALFECWGIALKEYTGKGSHSYNQILGSICDSITPTERGKS